MTQSRQTTNTRMIPVEALLSAAVLRRRPESQCNPATLCRRRLFFTGNQSSSDTLTSNVARFFSTLRGAIYFVIPREDMPSGLLSQHRGGRKYYDLQSKSATSTLFIKFCEATKRSMTPGEIVSPRFYILGPGARLRLLPMVFVRPVFHFLSGRPVFYCYPKGLCRPDIYNIGTRKCNVKKEEMGNAGSN